MSRATRSLYPAAAPVWMAGEAPARILDLASGAGAFAQSLAQAGHEVFCIDRDVDRTATLAEKLGTRLHVAGQVEALPFRPGHFDVVTASQTLHRFAPGLALSEIARVLRPGGRLAVAYNTRDDTVPWVRRLTGLMKDADSQAMAGDYGVDSLAAVADSPYFTGLEHKTFRNWVPITRAGLVTMVERRPATARLDPDVRERLLRQVGELYDSSARAPEPLLLPFQASCWRAQVDHSQLVIGDQVDDAVEVRL